MRVLLLHVEGKIMFAANTGCAFEVLILSSQQQGVYYCVCARVHVLCTAHIHSSTSVDEGTTEIMFAANTGV